MPMPLLTPGQAALVLGVSTETLRRWARDGEGPPYHSIGRSRRYDLGDLNTWSENGWLPPQARPEPNPGGEA